MSDLQKQYGTTDRLRSRGSLHARYATIGWFGWVAERMAFEPGTRVLDVGCGPAWFWSSMDEQASGLHLTLCDLSPGMIAAARERLEAANAFRSLESTVADGAALPFEDASFDAIVAMHMLYHLDDPGAALTEFRRVLRPGGRLFVTANAEGDLGSLHDLLTVFGPDGDGPVTSLLTLDQAETLMVQEFTAIARHDLVQTYRIDDPEAVLDYLLSFPPGDDATPEQRAALQKAIDAAFDGDILESERRTGLTVARSA